MVDLKSNIVVLVIEKRDADGIWIPVGTTSSREVLLKNNGKSQLRAVDKLRNKVAIIPVGEHKANKLRWVNQNFSW